MARASEVTRGLLSDALDASLLLLALLMKVSCQVCYRSRFCQLVENKGNLLNSAHADKKASQMALEMKSLIKRYL